MSTSSHAPGSLPPAEPVPSPGLRPLAALYGALTTWRNRAYDRGLKRTFSFDFPVIGVGNLRAGGTGKTPAVAYIVACLQERWTVGTLSRGYGRKTHGYRLVSAEDGPEQVGDEPAWLKQRFPDATVAVGERRVAALPSMLLEVPDTGVVVLDDAFQHRAIQPGLQILCTAWGQLYVDDALLPAGRLRESAAGAARADIILVTKCPADLDTATRASLMAHLQAGPGQSVFCSTLAYGKAWPLQAGKLTPTPGTEQEDGRNEKQAVPSGNTSVLLLTGIAEPAPLEAFARSQYGRVEALAFPDHHRWQAADLVRVRESWERLSAEGPVAILTTEKDAVRLASLPPEWLEGLPIWVQPVAMVFADPAEGKAFDQRLLDYTANAELSRPDRGR